MKKSCLPTIADVQQIKTRGPWATKSGGELQVLFALGHDTTQWFLDYNPEELARVQPFDIRGLRSYTVRGVPAERVGGTEWHRVRREIVMILEGEAQWICEDAFGGRVEFRLTPESGVMQPQYIMHTYVTIAQGTGLLVVANTLFDPDDPKTHDTYSHELFIELQARDDFDEI